MSLIKENQTKWRVAEPLSQVQTSCSSYFVYKTVRDLVDEAAESTPDRVLFHFPANDGLSLTAKELQARSRVLAQNLLHIGFKKGDRLAVALDSTYQALITFFAASIIGVIPVFFNPGFRKYEFEHLLRKISAKGLLVYDKLGPNDYVETITSICPEIKEANKSDGINSTNLPEFKHLIVIPQTDKPLYNVIWIFDELASQKLVERDYDLPYLDSDDVFTIVQTSGTTGPPKGVYNTQMGSLNGSKFMSEYVTEIKANQTYCNCVPFLSSASPLLTLMVFFNHCQIVFPYKSFSLPKLAEAIQHYKCKGFLGPPRIVEELIKFEERVNYKLTSLEFILSGTYDSKKELLENCHRLFPHIKTYVNMYGLSECLALLSNRIFMDKLADETDETIATMRPFAPIEYKIVDYETGRVQPLNEDGVLFIRSFSNMIGYWNDPEKTRETKNDRNWVNTGDCFRMNRDGGITTRGRVKFIMKIFTYTVYPAEVETYLARHPSVEESCVFGIPRESGTGEQMCAHIKLKKDAESSTSVEDIRTFCKSNFADYKVPTIIKFVDGFPRTPLGKIERATLMKEAQEELKSN